MRTLRIYPQSPTDGNDSADGNDLADDNGPTDDNDLADDNGLTDDNDLAEGNDAMYGNCPMDENDLANRILNESRHPAVPPGRFSKYCGDYGGGAI